MENIRTSVIETIQSAIVEAGRDWALWSQGKILYDAGTECLLLTYTARHLFAAFQSRPGVRIDIEPSLKSLGFNLPGRFDLTAEFANGTNGTNGTNVAVEFKRYSNLGERISDLDRLRRTVCQRPDWIGLFAAPDFDSKPDALLSIKQESGEEWHAGPLSPLPISMDRTDGRTHVRGLVIEAVTSNNA